MLVKDLKFRIVKKKNSWGNYSNCSNEKCPCNTPFLWGSEAQNRLGEYELQNCEVEIFTGFCDTNGKRIYEGDIVSFEADSHDMGILIIAGKVVFKNGRFIIEGYERFFPHYSFFDFVLKDKGIKIIGNIHENPELIGGEE